MRQALHSALVDQTVLPAELIAVYDGPVPSAVIQVIEEFAQWFPVRKIFFQENRGHGPARSAAIEACATPWIAIIDADDISRPDRFEKLLEEIKRHPECAVIGGGYTEFHDADEGHCEGPDVLMPETPEEILRYLQSRSPIAQPTAILRTEAIRAVGGYLPWFNNEDYYLWIRLASAGYPMRNVPSSLILFRTDPDLYKRRGGLRYWWNEIQLQLYSLRKGTTNLGKFLAGAIVRFVVQVLFPSRFRALFYQKVLRRT